MWNVSAKENVSQFGLILPFSDPAQLGTTVGQQPTKFGQSEFAAAVPANAGDENAVPAKTTAAAKGRHERHGSQAHAGDDATEDVG